MTRRRTLTYRKRAQVAEHEARTLVRLALLGGLVAGLVAGAALGWWLL